LNGTRSLRRTEPRACGSPGGLTTPGHSAADRLDPLSGEPGMVVGPDHQTTPLVRPAGLALSKTPAWGARRPTLFPPYDAPASLSGVVFVDGPRRSPNSYFSTRRFDCSTSRLQNVDRLQSAAGVLRRHSHGRPGVSARPTRSATDCNTRTTLRRCRRCQCARRSSVIYRFEKKLSTSLPNAMWSMKRCQ
jgi:hypothetical protein